MMSGIQQRPRPARRVVWPQVLVCAVASALLGGASFGWALRFGSALPGVALGALAVFGLPVVVPSLMGSQGRSGEERSVFAPALASIFGYLLALVLSYLLWAVGR